MSPDELFFGWKIQTTLNILRSPLISKTSTKNKTSENLKLFEVNYHVLSWYYQGEKWMFGTMQEKLGKLHYKVQLNNGYVLKRHRPAMFNESP